MPFKLDKFGNAVEITAQEFQDIAEQRVQNLVGHRIADYQQRKAELENQPTYGEERVFTRDDLLHQAGKETPYGTLKKQEL